MWVFTNTGFVSAVQKGKKIQVRSRDEKSLFPLIEFAGVELIRTPHGDYPYRVEISNEDFANWLSKMASNISYENFKYEVSNTRGYEFSDALSKVWSIMHDVEDEDARKRSWERIFPS
jgi:hypothetical protein